ncbi:MAG TPA: MlaD family protein [Candidatus Acidoferrales bacterium]|nr:MlaD family protein [Candidatus Acidoferrales bacterium]
MKNSLETRLGVFAVLVIIAAVLIVETLGGVGFFQRGYHLSALFNSAQELKAGDSVKMAGVEIGRVEKVALENNKVRVTMKLNTGTVVKTDSQASIQFTGLMGQNFVSIDFGSPDAPPAVDGAVLATVEQPDLNAIMAKLNDAATGIQNAMKGFTGDTINNLLGPLTDLIRQNTGHLTTTISNIQAISSQIASGQGSVGRMIYSDTFYDSTLAAVTNLQGTVMAARQVVDGVNEGRGTIGLLMTDDTLYHATTASMTNLNQVLQKINHGQGSVGKLVNDQEFYKNAKVTLQKVDKAADSLEDQGPLSVIGIVLGAVGL